MSKQLDNLILSMLDGSISQEKFKALEHELMVSPTARELYYQYASLHQSLEYRLSRTGLQPVIVGLADARLEQQRKKRRKLVLLTTAALLLLSFVGMLFLSTDPAPPALTSVDIATSPGARYTMTTEDGKTTDKISKLNPNSTLNIKQGSLELKFESGVKAIISAPAELSLLDNDNLKMNTGTAWFQVPEKAKGFTVTTPQYKVIDLGTEFGVISRDANRHEVHVFKGKVQVENISSINTGSEIILTKGKAIQLDKTGKSIAISTNYEQFQTTLPATLPHMHWPFESQDELLSNNTISEAVDINYTLHSNQNPSPSVHFIPGKFGNALSLDGISNCLMTDWQGILGNQPRTVAFWFKLNKEFETNRQPFYIKNTILGWGTQQTGNKNHLNSKWTIHLLYRNNSNTPTLVISFGRFWYTCDTIDLTANKWQHIAVVYHGEADVDGTPKTELFIDGESYTLKSQEKPEGTSELAFIPIETLPNTPFQIGANLSLDQHKLIDSSPLLKADIDELFIIEGAINEYSILHMMNTSKLQH